MKKTFENLNIEVDVRTSQNISFEECNEHINMYYDDNFVFRLHRNSSVKAFDNSSIEAFGNSSVKAFDNSSIEAFGNSSVVAKGNSSVVANRNSSVKAFDNSSIEAFGNSSVKAFDNSSIEAFGNSSIEAWGFSIIRKLSSKVTIEKMSDYITELSAVRKFKKNTTVFKKVIYDGVYVIAELECEKGQEFQSERGSKCRTSKAKVIAFYSYDRDKLDVKEALSIWDNSFKYKVGASVEVDYDENIIECSNGIHFYLTFEEAVKY